MRIYVKGMNSAREITVLGFWERLGERGIDKWRAKGIRTSAG